MKTAYLKYRSKAVVFAALLFLFFSCSFLKLSALENDQFSIKCGTFLTLGERNHIAKVYQKDSLGRPKCQTQYRSPSGIFLIHFDATGPHAVDPSDNNSNGIPDYVDSVAYYFEYVAKEYIELGMPSPYPDEGLGGDSSYDVYVKNIGEANLFLLSNRDKGGIYGWAEKSTQFTSSFPIRYRSYIVIDNDYSETDSIRREPEYNQKQGRAIRQAYKDFGIVGLKIAAAHQYSHAVHHMCGIEETTGALLAEMTGVYMEYTLFPESRDHVFYVNGLLNNPDKNLFIRPTAETGMKYCIFIDYITAKYGKKSIKRLWDYMSKYNTAYQSFEFLFEREETSLDSAWMDFMPWLYYTGSRAKPGYLPLAASYDELRLAETYIYEPFNNQIYSTILPFQFSLFRYLINDKGINYTSDTLDILVTNPMTEAILKYGYYNKTGFRMDITNWSWGGLSTTIFAYSPPKYFNFASDNGIADYKKFEYPGTDMMLFINAYPSPFEPSKDMFVYFPVPENAPAFSQCNLIIRDPSGTALFTRDYKSGIYDGRKAIQVESRDLPNTIATGVFVFCVETGNEAVVGKLAVGKN